MTPTLRGRWQTRLFLLGTFGLLITLLFIAARGSGLPLIALVIVAVTGLGWDMAYDRIQRNRWDHDWPPNLQLAAGVWEGVVTYLIMTLLFGRAITAAAFWSHYAAVWVAVFLASQSIMRVLFPHWRYFGGEIGRG